MSKTLGEFFRDKGKIIEPEVDMTDGGYKFRGHEDPDKPNSEDPADCCGDVFCSGCPVIAQRDTFEQALKTCRARSMDWQQTTRFLHRDMQMIYDTAKSALKE